MYNGVSPYFRLFTLFSPRKDGLMVVMSSDKMLARLQQIKKYYWLGVAFHYKATMQASKVEKSPKITLFGQKQTENSILPPNQYDIRKARKKSYLRSEHLNFIKPHLQQQIVDKRLKNYIFARKPPLLTVSLALASVRTIL